MKFSNAAGFKTMIIANPAAGNKSLQKRWAGEIHPNLKRHLKTFDYQFTQKKDDATLLCRQALKAGYNLIVSMGGDGTLNEVVNGFFENGVTLNPAAALGVLPFGSGGDFIRSLKLERDYRKIAPHFTTRQTRKIDIGLVEFKNKKFAPRYFINTVQIGLGAAIMKRVNRKNRKIPPLIRYVSGSFQGFLDYKPVPVQIELMPQGQQKILLTNLIIANGQYFGRGMRPAPHAILDDGLFDVMIIKKMSLAKFALLFPQLYTRKKWLPASVETFRASKISIAPLQDEHLLCTELDGEPCGEGTVKVTILPQSIVLKV